MDANNLPHSMAVDAVGPFTFGIGLQGEVVVGYHLRQTGDLLKFHLVIPPQEVQVLRRCLSEGRIQETLAAVPPTQSKH